MSRHYQREIELRRALRHYQEDKRSQGRGLPAAAAHRRRLHDLLISLRRHGGRPA